MCTPPLDTTTDQPAPRTSFPAGLAPPYAGLRRRWRAKKRSTRFTCGACAATSSTGRSWKVNASDERTMRVPPSLFATVKTSPVTSPA